MSFTDTLKSGCFCLELAATTKDAVLEELVTILYNAGKIQQRDRVLAAVREREQKMSTGLSDGIAIPHAKTDTVTEMTTVLAIKHNGLDFQAFDGQPSRIFIMTISPADRTGPHVRYLGQIGKLLKQPAIRERLMASVTPDDIVRALTDLGPDEAEGIL